MTIWSMEEALRFALKLEEENHAEYEKNAKEAANPGARSMFAFLAGEEKKHIQLIREKMAQFRVKP
jgi:rubrerythrin